MGSSSDRVYRLCQCVAVHYMPAYKLIDDWPAIVVDEKKPIKSKGKGKRRKQWELS